MKLYYRVEVMKWIVKDKHACTVDRKYFRHIDEVTMYLLKHPPSVSIEICIDRVNLENKDVVLSSYGDVLEG